MSLFVRIERYGSQPRILRLRGMQGTVGENEQGMLTAIAVQAPFFSVNLCSQPHLMVIHSQGAFVGDKPAAPGDTVRLSPGIKLTLSDTRFSFFTGSALSESLAHCNLEYRQLLSSAPPLSAMPAASLRLFGAHKCLPLPPGAVMLVGASAECALQIDLTGIKPLHCLLRNISGGVEIQAIEGQLSLTSQGAVEKYVIYSSDQFTLDPPGLELAVEIPKPCPL